jgi:hypothetical protein
VRGLSLKGVREWAIREVGLTEKNADILVAQEIDGVSLFLMAEDKLMYGGMKLGPAAKLMAKVNALKALLPGETGTQCGE